MSTYTVNIPNYGLDTDAKMRAAIQQFEAAIIACGFIWDPTATYVSQFDPTTVIKPTTAYTHIGYRFYKFNDALQSTAPLHLFVAYQTGTTAQAPAFYVGVANYDSWTHNKPGSTSAWCLNAPGDPGLNGGSCRFSGDGSRLQVHLWKDYGNASAYGSLERTKNEAGQDTGEGIMFTWGKTGPTTYTGAWNRDGSYSSNENKRGFVNQVSSTTLVVGGDKYVLPIRAFNPGPLPPMMGTYAYINSDFTKAVPVQILCMDGQYHTYLPIGNDSPVYSQDAGVGGTLCQMIRWE